MMRTLLAVWLTFEFFIVAVGAAENPLYEELISSGVRLAAGDRILLPPASIGDGLRAAEQEMVIQEVAERYGLREFTRDSVVAPFVLKIDSLKNSEGKPHGQRMDVWFAARGSLQAAIERELLDELIAMPKTKDPLTSAMRELSKEELLGRGIVIKPSASMKESYSYFDVPILDRVQVSGVSRAVTTQSAESMLVAARLDPRFENDTEMPNRWRSIDHDESGHTKLGAPNPYCEYGVYIKLTALVDASGEPNGILFVEVHVVFDEPEGWFGGANLLRSKLPLVAQDGVRDFRRKLKKVEKEVR